MFGQHHQQNPEMRITAGEHKQTIFKSSLKKGIDPSNLLYSKISSPGWQCTSIIYITLFHQLNGSIKICKKSTLINNNKKERKGKNKILR